MYTKKKQVSKTDNQLLNEVHVYLSREDSDFYLYSEE